MDSGVHHLDLPSHCCPSLSTAAPRGCMSVVLIQLPPPAGACQAAPPNCSSLAVAGLLTAAFQLGLKTVSGWCFPTRDVLLQIGVQCLRAVDEGGEGIPLSNQECSTATSQHLLTSLSKLPLHVFFFGRPSFPPWKYNWPQPPCAPSRQRQPARQLRDSQQQPPAG